MPLIQLVVPDTSWKKYEAPPEEDKTDTGWASGVTKTVIASVWVMVVVRVVVEVLGASLATEILSAESSGVERAVMVVV